MTGAVLRNSRRVPLTHPVVIGDRTIASVSVAWPNPASVALLSLIAAADASVIATVSALTSLSPIEARELHVDDLKTILETARRIA